MNVKDRSNNGAPEPTHYSGHLATSDSRAHAETSQTLGTTSDGQPSQAPRIPAESDYTEVSTVVASPEACTAEVADCGGAEGNGSQAEGATGLGKSVTSPVTAYLDGRIGKNASVSSHPHVMRAHQLGSITAADHKAVHGAEKCGTLAKPGSNLPKGDEGVAEALDEATVSAHGSTMPAQKVEKAFQVPIVLASSSRRVDRGLPIRAGKSSGVFVNGILNQVG